MQSSKKNKRIVLGMGVLVILLGLFCLKQVFDSDTEKVSEVSKKPVKVDHTKYFAMFSKANEDSKLYRKVNDKYIACDEVYKDATLLIDIENSNVENDYYKLQNTDKYVYYKDITPVENFTRDQSYLRYLVFNENVVSKVQAELFDQNGVKKYKSLSKIDAPIYMKKDGFIYIVYNDELLGIVEKDIDTIKMNQNTELMNASKVPVFMYHFFYDEQAGEVGVDGNFMEIHTFENQLNYAKENGYQSIRMDDLNLYMDGAIQLPPRSFVITMDDNAESVKRLAYPVLETTQTFATSFVISSWIEQADPYRSPYVELQSHSDAMHTGGCSGQGHGGRLLCISYEQGVADLKNSSLKLDGAFVLAYPFGDVNDAAKQIVRDAGYHLAFTTKHGSIHPGMDKLELPRIRISKSVTVEVFARLLEE